MDARENSVVDRSNDGGRTIFVLPILLLAIFIVLKVASPGFYLAAVQEDSFVEYFQSIFFFLVAPFALSIGLRLLKSHRNFAGLLYLVFSIGLLLIALEEISWGQRIFHFKCPGFFTDHNDQREINLHNLRIFQSYLHIIYILIGCYGSFVWLIYSRVSKRRKYTLSYLFVPPGILMFYFLPVSLLYSYIELHIHVLYRFIDLDTYTFGHFMHFRDQEPTKLLLALGVFIFVVSTWAQTPSRTKSQNTTHRSQRKFSQGKFRALELERTGR